MFPKRKVFRTAGVLSFAQCDSTRASLHLGQKTRPETREGSLCSRVSEIDQRVMVRNNRWSQRGTGMHTSHVGTPDPSSLYTQIKSAPPGSCV